MRKVVCSLVILINSVYLFAQWKPVGGRIMTEWAAKIDVENVLPEYPRPIMERADWINLNGLWNYAISPVGQAMPQSYDGRILVPFAVESSLSGVGKSLGEKNELWYQRQFSVPSSVSLLYPLNGEEKGFCFILELLIGKLRYGLTI